MKKALLLTALLLMVTAAQAQRIHAYVAGGATVSQVEGDELKGFKKWGGTGGVGAMIKLTENNRWKMSVEVDFAQRGFKNNIKRKDTYVTNITLNYIDIPLAFHFHDNKGGIEVGAGFLYGRLVGRPHGTIDYPSTFIPDTSTFLPDSTPFLKNDLAALLDLRFTIWRGLQINLRFQYSIIPIKKDWKFTQYNDGTTTPDVWYNNCRNISIMARLIYEFGTGDDNGGLGRKSKKRKR